MKKRFIRIASMLCIAAMVGTTGTVFAGTPVETTRNLSGNDCMGLLLKCFALESVNDKWGNIDFEFPEFGGIQRPETDTDGNEGTGSDCQNTPNCERRSGCSDNNSSNGNPGNKPNNNTGDNSTGGNTNNNVGNSGNNSASTSSYAKQVAKLVNEERRETGLSSLTLSSELSKVAQAKAEDMRDKGYFSHTSPTYGSPFEMMKQFGIKYTSAGENIAKGQRTPESVMNAWMNSQGHRANILSTSYEQIGVGYCTDARGNTYWVQMFIK